MIIISKLKISICIYVNNYLGNVKNIFKKVSQQNFESVEIICIIDEENIAIHNLIKHYQSNEENIKILFKDENNNLLDYINGEYVLILDSKNWISSLDLDLIYKTSKRSNLDIFMFNQEFTYENINKKMTINFKDKKDFEKIFCLSKFICNMYKTSFLEKKSFNIPLDNNSFDCLYFYFVTLFSTSKIIFSNYNLFNKRIFDNKNSIHENILIDFQILSNDNFSNKLNNKNFFDNISNLLNFFKGTGLYYDYKYHLLNYLFNLCYNIYKSNICNSSEYFTYLRKFINDLSLSNHVDLILLLKPDYIMFYQNVLNSNSISELNLHDDYNKLLIENEKLQFKYDKLAFSANKFLMGRVDIKNEGNEDNSLEVIDISDNDASIDFPKWFKNNSGNGLVIHSSKGCMDIKLKCINDGEFKLFLRGIDFRNFSNHRMPIFINFTKLILNEELIFDENNLVWCYDPFLYSFPVKNNDEVNIHIEWTPMDRYNDFNYELVSKKSISSNLTWIDFIFSARFDILNRGNDKNTVEIIEISDESASMKYPEWFKNDFGSGVVIQSSKGHITFKIKCINDGNLDLNLRGVDFRGFNNHRIPISIEFNKFLINDEVIFDENILVWHDNPFSYSVPVKHNEEYTIRAEWTATNETVKRKIE